MRAPGLAAAATAALLAVVLPALAIVARSSPGSAAGEAPVAGIPPDLVPIYRDAAEAYNVSWLLLAAIHERETKFSALDAPGVRDGANGCGAAGPMQFGVVGVPPYNAAAPNCGALTGTGAGATWARYRDARDRLGLDRSGASRPPSCKGIRRTTGCVYVDLDAIAACAAYLHDLGAGPALDDRAWEAARAYNGAPAYADAVMARAREWATDSAPVPANAPAPVAGAIAAADEISDRPYALRHWPTHIANPTYDCSSATSHVLWGAHAFGTAPWVSGELMSYGEPGPGRWISVYANEGHAFVVVAGRRFDTARYDTGPHRSQSGPRWREGPRPTANFVVRHPAGL